MNAVKKEVPVLVFLGPYSTQGERPTAFQKEVMIKTSFQMWVIRARFCYWRGKSFIFQYYQEFALATSWYKVTLIPCCEVWSYLRFSEEKPGNGQLRLLHHYRSASCVRSYQGNAERKTLKVSKIRDKSKTLLDVVSNKRQFLQVKQVIAKNTRAFI